MTISGKILLTGGTGTLGHAIVQRAVANNWPCDITVTARSELQLARMKRKFPNIRTAICDVRDAREVRQVVAGHDVVLHLAAMKRIPECEKQPSECYRTNVIGSRNVVEAAVSEGVKWCLGISTDKACKATTTYGASKLFMESIFKAYAAMSNSRCLVNLVRYGNVVASNGSVIPIWREYYQKEQSCPVTHADMSRFWMSPEDAVDLVELAKFSGQGEILVPKMGALSLVEMLDYICEGAKWHTIGLRSLEKIHEDLVHAEEPATETTTHYTILPVPGAAGLAYTSKIAPRVTKQRFLEMLSDAEKLEAIVRD